MLRKFVGLTLALLVGLGVIAGIVFSASDKHRADAADAQAKQLKLVRGLIGSEKEGFYRDPRVQAAFARMGMQVEVQKAGSREMAELPNLKDFDFGHPAGSPAAQRLRQVSKTQHQFTPFFTPMAVASWKKLLPMLEANGLVKQRDGTYYIIDMKHLLQLSAQGTRWRDLKSNTVYDTGRAILISSTDVRKSNSAAMYLALASYLYNDSNVVQSENEVNALLPKVSSLFLRQGFLESSSAGPFEDYTSMGMGKAPLVMVYESQFLEYQARLPQPNPEMVLLYPQPTIFTKHVLVPLTDAGDRVGEALERDPELQRLAAEYGFRGAAPEHFTEFLKQKKLTAPASLDDVIDPPSFKTLERMINGIASQMN